MGNLGKGWSGQVGVVISKDNNSVRGGGQAGDGRRSALQDKIQTDEMAFFSSAATFKPSLSLPPLLSPFPPFLLASLLPSTHSLHFPATREKKLHLQRASGKNEVGKHSGIYISVPLSVIPE